MNTKNSDVADDLWIFWNYKHTRIWTRWFDYRNANENLVPPDMCAQRKLKSACYSRYTPSEDSDQTVRMLRLIWLFAWRTCPKVRFLTLRLYLMMHLKKLADFMTNCANHLLRHVYPNSRAISVPNIPWVFRQTICAYSVDPHQM